MKQQVVYLTKNKVWIEGVAADWVGNGLTDILKANKEKLKSAEVRIILGNDMSFVAAFPASKVGELTREKIAIETKNHLPIEVEVDSFDWKQVVIDKEVWIQSVAMEREYLEYLSRAVGEVGLKPDLLIPMVVLLGERSTAKEQPVIIKWAGNENLSILATGGLVDSVYTEIPDDQIITFAKNKWGKETNPEIVSLDETSFKISEEAFKAKIKGTDAEVLDIPILTSLGPVMEKTVVENTVIIEQPGVQTTEIVNKEPRFKQEWIAGLLILTIVVVFVLGGWLILGRNQISPVTTPGTPVVVVINPTATPTPTATPSAEVDLSKFVLQVLNGSGESGVAAGIRDYLLTGGFVTVDIGNTAGTEKSSVRAKANVPVEGVSKVRESLANYVINDTEILTEDSKYDIVVIIGSEKK